VDVRSNVIVLQFCCRSSFIITHAIAMNVHPNPYLLLLINADKIVKMW